MLEDKTFTGFSPETVRFFQSLKRNNTKEWFERHREIYERHVLEPAKAFVQTLGTRLKGLAPRLVAAPRVNKSIFRLNRDIRFSADQSPYKTNLGIYFWEGQRSRMECPGFYFHFEPSTLLLGGGFYMFPDWLLDPFRRWVVHPEYGPRLARIVGHITETTDFELGGNHYKRIPAGYDASHPNAEFLLHNGLHAGMETKLPDEFFTPGLVDYCFEKYKPLVPLHHWLVDLAEQATVPSRGPSG
jgi:uncharacterized protein (TIGR02453 family)